MENILFLILGWLLGLVGPWLTELIQTPYRRKQFKKSLFIELTELRYKLAAITFVVASNNATVNRNLIDWLTPIMLSDKRPHDNLINEDALKSLSGLKDEAIKTFSQKAQSQNPKNNIGLNLKKYALPFLTSQISMLSLFTPEFQRVVLEIHAQLEILNEEIDVARFNFEKTFDSSLSNTSYAAVRGNLAQSHQNIADTARHLANRIGILFKMEK